MTRSVGGAGSSNHSRPVSRSEQELPPAARGRQVAGDTSVELGLSPAGEEAGHETADGLVRGDLRSRRAENEPGGERVRVEHRGARPPDVRREDEVGLADRQVGDRPGDVDVVAGSRCVHRERRDPERARVQHASPPALALAAPEDRVRAALGERLDDADRAVGPEHGGRGRGRDALREALRGDPRRGEAAVRAHPHEAEGGVFVGFLDRVRDGRAPRGVDREAGDPEEGAFGCVRDLEHPPAGA